MKEGHRRRSLLGEVRSVEYQPDGHVVLVFRDNLDGDLIFLVDNPKPYMDVLVGSRLVGDEKFLWLAGTKVRLFDRVGHTKLRLASPLRPVNGSPS